MSANLKGERIALLGLSFKPNTDDRRGASLEIGSALDSLGARVAGYDPVAGKGAARRLPLLKVVFDPYEAFQGEDSHNKEGTKKGDSPAPFTQPPQYNSTH